MIGLWEQKYGRFIFTGFLLVSLMVYFGFTIDDDHNQNHFAQTEKQKGTHLFGYRDSINIKPLQDHNFNWITLVPFGGQESYDSPDIRHSRGDNARVIKRNASWLDQIKVLHDAGFKVFIKPHIWLHDSESGKWRSDIFPTNEANWETWKKAYRDFIFRWAEIAEKGNAEMFCIGTELTKLTKEKPEFWRQLIKDVRNIYNGKITYAGNWYKEYEQITFWEELDYIGIQAYFPLVKNEKPSIDQISKAWNKHLSDIESISKEYKRQVIFTEIGYKSTTDAAIKPWEWIDYADRDARTESTETQANCYQAFFDTVWDKEWFAGVHIWQWRSNFEQGDGKKDFTPQGKSAAKIIAKGFE